MYNKKIYIYHHKIMCFTVHRFFVGIIFYPYKVISNKSNN